MYRTHTCGELTAKEAGKTVTLCGRVNKVRNLGGMSFIDLRDRYGITQITHDPAKSKIEFPDVKSEYVVQIVGEVVARPESMINKDMATGAIEINTLEVKVLTKAKLLPFSIVDEPNTSEENRFKHRYLDLRRRKILDNVLFRSKMLNFTRNWFSDKGFVDVQTPIFTVSSPEGARDYLVPSRINPGQFYALPQAPQQYKQLLMVGGIDKYFQIAPCFRDEDPRADRHSCEFYQIDCEMSFVNQDDVYAIVEGYLNQLIPTLSPHKKITVAFKRLKHREAVDQYGSDKPDLRFGMSLVDMTQDFAQSGFSVFKDTVAANGTIKAMKFENKILTRKEADELTEEVKKNGAKGLAYLCFDAEGVKGSIAKFFTPEEMETIKTKTGATTGDSVLFVADAYDVVTTALGRLRIYIRDKYLNLNKDDLAFCWIEDFPLFEMTDEGKLDFCHNPFSIVKGGAEALNNSNKLEIYSEQYDLSCNGYEILSGSIRNHDPELLLQAFKMVGRGEDEIKQKFGAMYEAFQFGPPPHGGFAIGFDRLLMILKDEENIREVYAFPKSGRAQDVMMGAPGFVDQNQLDDLGIELNAKTKKLLQA
ncbi:MAG: aspartate--tRNA ligase [candidate division SR1 bacterium]|nr:aspartate--tRNA ligase [candidate division SR1 bacterium]